MFSHGCRTWRRCRSGPCFHGIDNLQDTPKGCPPFDPNLAARDPARRTLTIGSQCPRGRSVAQHVVRFAVALPCDTKCRMTTEAALLVESVADDRGMNCHNVRDDVSGKSHIAKFFTEPVLRNSVGMFGTFR